MQDLFSIIEKPLITEKSTRLAREQNKFVFRVNPAASKIEIRRAVEQFFNVKVTDVATMNVRGKKRRLGRFSEGHTAHWKKAIVTVKQGQKIPIFEGV